MPAIETNFIELRPNRDGQPRAFLVGTRMRVQDIYCQAEVYGKTPDEIVAAFPHLSLAQVHAALAYYFDNRESVREEMRQDDEFVRLMQNRVGEAPTEQVARQSPQS